MVMKTLAEKNRSYRSFDESRTITRAELEELVGLARVAASSVNMQPLKYRLVYDPQTVAAVQPNVYWAKRFKDIKLPPEGHLPTGFIAICLDANISKAAEGFQKDVGIVAQTILLGAVEMGLGGCMIGNYNDAALREALKLDERYRLLLMVALGKPDEVVIMDDAAPGADVGYFRDENFVHHAPKRSLAELIIPEG